MKHVVTKRSMFCRMRQQCERNILYVAVGAQRFLREKKGQGTTEYAILVGVQASE